MPSTLPAAVVLILVNDVGAAPAKTDHNPDDEILKILLEI